MIIVKITPAWLDTSGFLLIVIVFWWLCRLCATAKAPTLCDRKDVCACDFVGRILCSCPPDKQDLNVSRDGVDQLPEYASYVKIQDCAAVRIGRKALQDLRSLVRVHLSNVKNLTLEEHSFSWNDSAIHETYANSGITIEVENTTVSNLPTYVFRGRVDAILFTGVRVELVKSYAFTSLAGTKVVAFKNCEFGQVENQAFKKFVVEHAFSVVGGRFASTLPSRTMMNVVVRNEFQIMGVTFERVRSSAFQVQGPRKFQIQNCYFGRVDGEAFAVHTRGPVFIDDNAFRVVDTGAFVAINVEKHALDLTGPQELIFENNTIAETRRASLLFDVNGFRPKIDWIYLNTRCECHSMADWLSELIVFSRRYPHEKIAPGVKLDEVISCRDERGEYARLKDFSQGHCGDRAAPLQMFAFAAVALLLALLALALCYRLWRKSRRTRWMNVPQSSPTHEPAGARVDSDTAETTDPPSPCYEEPSTSRRQIVTAVPAAPSYKDTELRVIVECAEPSRRGHEYANPFREREHVYSNRYVELGANDYRGNRYAPARRHQLLTSDL